MASKLAEKYINQIRRIIDGKSEIIPSDYYDPMFAMTSEWTDNVINQLQYQADEEAGHVTQLGQNIKQKSKGAGETFQIEVDAPFYWKFFNYGVTGSGNPAPSSFYGTQVFDSLLDYKFTSTAPHPDMINSIREWIPSTGLFGGQRSEDYDSIAYGISVNVLKRGLKPKPFVEIIFEETKVVDQFAKDIADVTQVIFEELFRENEN